MSLIADDMLLDDVKESWFSSFITGTVVVVTSGRLGH